MKRDMDERHGRKLQNLRWNPLMEAKKRMYESILCSGSESLICRTRSQLFAEVMVEGTGRKSDLGSV